MMEPTEILTAMGGLKLFGMRAAYDEIVATAVKRQHEPQRVVGDLLAAELSEKQARSIKYQITVAKLPLAKEIEVALLEKEAAAGEVAHQRLGRRRPRAARDRRRSAACRPGRLGRDA
jgi:hypothetical protein